MNDAIEKLKAQHGQLVQCEIDGRVLAFRAINKAGLQDLRKQLRAKPDLAVELSINACKFCCVFGKEHVDELTDRYPLAFAGYESAPGVIDHLMDLARGGAVISIV